MFELLYPYILPVLIGLLVYYIGIGLRGVYTIMLQRNTVSFDLHSHDAAAWEWFLDWFEHDAPNLMVRHSRHIRLRPDVSEGSIRYVPNDHSEAARFRFDGHVIRLLQNTPKENPFARRDTDDIQRSVTFWTYSGDTRIFVRLVQAMRASYIRRLGSDTRVFIPVDEKFGRNMEWRHLRSAPPRPLSSVVLSRDVEARVIADLDWFVRPGARVELARRNLPYRRGWMLTGPPGSGKTSMIMAVAARLRVSVHFLSLTSRSMNDTALMLLMNPAPFSLAENSIRLIVLEDIDVLFPKRVSKEDAAADANDEHANNVSTFVTQSGLFNVLDGASAPENVFIIMTTNHPENLDPAMMRAGRADCIFELGPPDEDRIRRYFALYNENSTHSKEADAFLRICQKDFEDAPKRCSMARVRELSVVHAERKRLGGKKV